MPTTRSASKKQTKIDDFKPNPEEKQAISSKRKQGSINSSSSTKANTAVKRKALLQDAHLQETNKKPKTDDAKDERETDQTNKPITINRSPVLQLWGASVAQFVQPDELWETCLSIGGSIASLCAISKGRAIGKIDPPDESADQSRNKKSEDDDARSLEVMGFPMQIKDGIVNVKGKPKTLTEKSLEGKYGGSENYQRAKQTMQSALESWTDDKDELEKRAFHFYEEFRPGSGGWGQKGQLDLDKVSRVVKAARG